MRIILGLGNPGKEYAHTRHNFGWDAVEALATELGATFRKDAAFHAHVTKIHVNGEAVILALPTTFMNLSGQAASAILSFYKALPSDLLVVQDELDLPLGMMRFAFDRSAAGHNGVSSVEAMLGTRGFSRLRLGIDRPATPQPIENYVLEPFRGDERVLAEQMRETAPKAILSWINDGLDSASQTWNGKKG
ncbi:aminoacyl-tRNA hydrolase [Patescibacteria group bacterium]|nr:aminoacyl-tRNA hydrolase [Patescibacteria group bacterium]